MTESERGLGRASAGAAGGEDEVVILVVSADGEAATALDDGGASGGISRPSGGDSMICAVELKYRARFGRRNVGGRADTGIRMSRTDFQTDLLSILVMRAPRPPIVPLTFLKHVCLDFPTEVVGKSVGASVNQSNRTSARRNPGASELKL